MNKTQRIEHLSQATGVDSSSVDKVLGALTETARAQISEGFSLPGFGKFQLVPGPKRTSPNPYRPGETMDLYSPPILEFAPSAAALDLFREAKQVAVADDKVGEPCEPLPEIRLYPEQEDLRAAGLTENPHSRVVNKLGGGPDWIQDSSMPKCCGHGMLFYGQFSSDTVGEEFNLVDAGVIYVFFCDYCYEPRAILQFH